MIREHIEIVESAIEGERVAVPLDGTVFEMLSSSTSAVAAEPTRFSYFENDGVVWGDYAGDTVVEGRFAGVREGDTVRLSYNHRSASGALTHGNAVTVVSRTADGALRLTEFYASAAGPEASACVEVR
ncbi:hypothetical protein AB3K78_12285 [Leucobacter sp. HNU]|uniref:hypothetical protein n=1 Tax=Leucobacter sp. HNU TaxID=3236805 RepID=UPI003A801B87